MNEIAISNSDHCFLKSESSLKTMDYFSNNTTKAVKIEKIAIVGMDTFFANCNGLDAFERSIYEGVDHFIPLPSNRLPRTEDINKFFKNYNFAATKNFLGGYIEDFKINIFANDTSANENKVEKLSLQQALMLQVSSRAIQDGSLEEGQNVAIIIAADTKFSAQEINKISDLPWQLKDSINQATGSSRTKRCNSNIIANQISALWNFHGSSFTINVGENSAFKALEVAQMLLSTGQVDAVVVGAIDLVGELENIGKRNQFAKINTGVNTLSYDQFCNGWMLGEGAGAVVLKRHDTAKHNGDRIYAVIDAISFAQQNFTKSELNNTLANSNAKAVNQACQQAFNIAGIQPADINYLEVFGSGIAQQDEAEITGLLQAYGRGENGLDCAIGSVKANIGHTFVASGIASLIKTALCLYHRYIPATPKWSGVKKSQLWQGSPFYVAPKPRPWFIQKEGAQRVAAINSMGIDGSYAHVILSEESSQQERNTRYLEQMPFYLFPLAANERSELLEEIKKLQDTIENSSSLSATASQTYAAFKQRQKPNYSLVILGHNKQELAREIAFALKGVSNAFDRGKDWETPLGSYFTAEPLGRQGAIAYVYPAAANSFLGIGWQLLRLFPNLYEDSNIKNNYSRVAEVEKLLYPRSLNKLSTRKLKEIEEQFLENPVATFETEVTFASFYTTILRDNFLVQPKYVFGYSMGEISMMNAQGVWSNFYQASNTLNSFSFFRNRLSGPKNAVREYWGLPITADSADKEFWSTYVLIATPSQVRKGVKGEEHVYLIQINAPEEVLIAGDTQACKRVIKTLGCRSFPAPFNHAIHCEAMRSEYNSFVKINTYKTQKVSNVFFYSAAEYAPIKLDSYTIAHSIAKVLCEQVDFPRLVHRVYEDGARIFIEVGAGSSCSRWIDKILDNKKHTTVALNRKGVDDHTSILKAIAKLVSHQVSLDLSPLYSQANETSTPSKSMAKTITLSEHRIIDTRLREENWKLSQKLSSNPQQQTKTDRYQLLLSQEREQNILPITECNIKNMQISNPQLEDVTMKNVLDSVNPARQPHLDQSEYQHLGENNLMVYQAHAAFLKARQESSQQLSEIIQLQIACIENLLIQSETTQ